MTAEAIAKVLGGRKGGGGWTARCPAHDDPTPGLSIRDADDNKVLVHCHAGCDQQRVIAMPQALGLWTATPPSILRCACSTRVERKPDQADAERTEAVPAVWRSAKPHRGTHVEAYLGSRRICVPTPVALRINERLPPLPQIAGVAGLK
jgi:putative DNA primase/helicase